MEKKNDNAIVKWFKDMAELIKSNKKISIAILAFVVIVAIIITICCVVSSRANSKPEVEVETVNSEADEYVITEDPIEVDAYTEINELMRKYYDASANGDVAVIESIKIPVDDKDKIIIAEKAQYVEDYPVVTCYTKKGPVEDSYLVFAYYEVKLYDYDNTAPGLNAWYVCKRDDGSYYINDDAQDEKLANYCKIICVQDDVVDLNNTVSVKFNEVVNKDPELASYLELLPELLTASVGEELVKSDNPEPDTAPEETVDEPGETVAQGEKEGKTTDVVNIRSSDSENADKVGKAQKGDKFKVLEQKVNGWSKIIFEGKECYIKSEYIEIIGEESTGSDNQTASTSNNDTVTDAEALANSPSSGKAKARDAVNVRKTDSTDGEKLAMAYKGEEMTVIEKQSNGWTKVKFNGKTGYVKSEYLE